MSDNLRRPEADDTDEITPVVPVPESTTPLPAARRPLERKYVIARCIAVVVVIVVLGIIATIWTNLWTTSIFALVTAFSAITGILMVTRSLDLRMCFNDIGQFIGARMPTRFRRITGAQKQRARRMYMDRRFPAHTRVTSEVVHNDEDGSAEWVFTFRTRQRGHQQYESREQRLVLRNCTEVNPYLAEKIKNFLPIAGEDEVAQLSRQHVIVLEAYMAPAAMVALLWVIPSVAIPIFTSITVPMLGHAIMSALLIGGLVFFGIKWRWSYSRIYHMSTNLRMGERREAVYPLRGDTRMKPFVRITTCEYTPYKWAGWLGLEVGSVAVRVMSTSGPGSDFIIPNVANGPSIEQYGTGQIDSGKEAKQ